MKDVDKNDWSFIFHYESLEKIKIISEKMRLSDEFKNFRTYIIPGSIRVTVYHQLKNW